MNYNFANKRHWRRTLWNQIESLSNINRNNCIVVCLDTTQGGEVEFLLRRGYRPQNIYAVNYNVAQVVVMNKNISKRLGCKVNILGIGIDRAIQKIISQGITPNVVNMDFCSQLCKETINTMQNVSASLPSNSVISVNLLRGREKWQNIIDVLCPSDNTSGTVEIENINDLDAARLDAIKLCMTRKGWSWKNVVFGKYKSTSNQTMMFAVGKLCDTRRELDKIKNMMLSEQSDLKIKIFQLTNQIDIAMKDNDFDTTSMLAAELRKVYTDSKKFIAEHDDTFANKVIDNILGKDARRIIW